MFSLSQRIPTDNGDTKRKSKQCQEYNELEESWNNQNNSLNIVDFKNDYLKNTVKNSSEKSEIREYIPSILNKIQSIIRAFLTRKKYKKDLKKDLSKNTKIIISLMKINYFGDNIKKYEDAYPNFWIFLKENRAKPNIFQIYTELMKFKEKNRTSFYTGYLDNLLRKNGQGILYDSDCRIFVGNWVNNEFNGYGKLIESEGNLIEGKNKFMKEYSKTEN